MFSWRLIFLIFCIFGILVADKVGSREPTPRTKDGKTYKQWCCSRCEHWNSAYGPPYTCSNCGKTMPL